MRFQQYLDDENPFQILEYYMIFGDQLNEMGLKDDTFLKIQALGQKMGIKVRKSKTFHLQLKKAGVGIAHLMKLVFDYSLHADIMDKDARKKLEQDIKAQFAKVNRQDVISFIVNVDKTFLGITSIPRHVMQNLLGITIATYDNWRSDQDYIKVNLEKIISVLDSMGDTEDLELAKRIYSNVTGVAI